MTFLNYNPTNKTIDLTLGDLIIDQAKFTNFPSAEKIIFESDKYYIKIELCVKYTQPSETLYQILLNSPNKKNKLNMEFVKNHAENNIFNGDIELKSNNLRELSLLRPGVHKYLDEYDKYKNFLKKKNHILDDEVLNMITSVHPNLYKYTDILGQIIGELKITPVLITEGLYTAFRKSLRLYFKYIKIEPKKIRLKIQEKYGDSIELSTLLLSDKDLDDIIFQIFAYMYMYKKYENMVVNDLHFGNMIIKRLDKPKKIDIIIHNKKRTRNVSIFVTFIDMHYIFLSDEILYSDYNDVKTRTIELFISTYSKSKHNDKSPTFRLHKKILTILSEINLGVIDNNKIKGISLDYYYSEIFNGIK